LPVKVFESFSMTPFTSTYSKPLDIWWRVQIGRVSLTVSIGFEDEGCRATRPAAAAAVLQPTPKAGRLVI